MDLKRLARVAIRAEELVSVTSRWHLRLRSIDTRRAARTQVLAVATAIASLASLTVSLGVHDAAWAFPPLPCTLEPGPTRTVAEVMDGETVRLDDGIEVRLMGMLAPRPRDAGMADAASAWPPAERARAALAALVGGRSVALAFGGERSDRYGRVLAHLVVERDGEQVWVQGLLVETGHARADALAGGDPCFAPLVARERKARQDGIGLWVDAAYQVRPGDRPTELSRYRHTFQLVRGRIERVRRTRSLVIAELASAERPAAPEGRSQWNAFHVVWRSSRASALGLDAADSLIGRNIIVRGWIEDNRGPEIEIVVAGQLEPEE